MAPLLPFRALRPREGAVVGFSANTAIADGTSLYLRYEGYHRCRHHFRPW